jgi:D-alanyl-D-alanine carboxypeptidase/D-alanyl-D-alanine-endopeptidase (penicillin-binding protein 4)
VIGALSVITLLVVVLDVSGVIFTEEEAPEPPPPVAAPELPDAADALPVAVVPAVEPADPRLVRDVAAALEADALGPSVHGVVTPLADPTRPWLDIDGDRQATPASTLKLWTAIAVLDGYAPEARLATEVVWDAAAGRLVLVGGGDATLTTDPERGASTASLTELALVTARALRRQDVESIRLGYDDTLFSGSSVSPQWEPIYVSSGVIAPVTSLMTDQGRVDPVGDAREVDPASAAADRFAELLTDQAIEVRGAVAPAVAVDTQPMAQVLSPPMSDLVERMLRDSDNQLAESLGRLAAIAQGEPGSFGGMASALEQAASSRAVDLGAAAIWDASGLARQDTLPPTSLVEALHAASREPELASVLTGLAVSGFDGTLADRFAEGDLQGAAGLVRAKTGTLTGISAEAGFVTTCAGDVVAFAFVADEVPDTEGAREALDAAAAALTTCRGD